MAGVNREDIECMCCRYLMVEPTTLNCGHSFCRLCMVQWCRMSNKNTCMVCQSPWTSLPHVSITIRNMIENQYREEYKTRCNEILTDENRKVIKQFEDDWKTANVQNLAGRLNNIVGAPNAQINRLKNKYFLNGVVFALAVGFIGMVVSYFFGSHETLTQKPVVKWTNDEVVQWLTGLGPWTQESLVETFTNRSIDGSLLIALSETEEDLGEIVSNLDKLHQKSFKVALSGAVNLGTKPPQDLWEFKGLHLLEVFCLVFIMPAFPRLVLIHFYMFEYKDIFLPLIQRVCPVVQDINDISIYTYQFADPTWGQYIDFIWKVLFLPHLSVYLQFTWSHIFNTNMWVAMFIIMDCVVQTALQMLHYFTCYQRGWSYTKLTMRGMIKNGYNLWIVLVFVYVFWNFIPTIVCNIAIYFFGVFGPIGRVMQLWKEHKVWR